MPKFIVSEMYRIEHEVEAESADDAMEIVNESNDYQYTIQINYDHRPGGPYLDYESQSTTILNLETMEVTE